MKDTFTHIEQADYKPQALLEGLSMVFAESCTDLARAALSDSPEHQKRVRQYTQTFNEVCNKLGDKHRNLMHKLEALENALEADREELIYLQGYIDCVALLRLIKII